MNSESVTPPQGELEPRFEALVRAHYARLYGVAFSYLRSAEAAEDAVQGVLLKAWRQRVVLELPDPLPYLFRAVRNQCVMALRRERRWREVELDAERPQIGAATPTQVLEVAGVPVRASRSVVAPRLKVRDFDFTSLIDAICSSTTGGLDASRVGLLRSRSH